MKLFHNKYALTLKFLYVGDRNNRPLHITLHNNIISFISGINPHDVAFSSAKKDSISICSHLYSMGLFLPHQCKILFALPTLQLLDYNQKEICTL